MTPEIADPIGVEAMALGSGLVLAIEDAGNDLIGMELGEASNQTDRVLIGANGPLAFTRAVKLDLGQHAGASVQGEMNAVPGVRLAADRHERAPAER